MSNDEKRYVSGESERVLKEAFEGFERQHRDLRQQVEAAQQSIEAERRGVIKTIRELADVPEDWKFGQDEDGTFYFEEPADEAPGNPEHKQAAETEEGTSD